MVKKNGKYHYYVYEDIEYKLKPEEGNRVLDILAGIAPTQVSKFRKIYKPKKKKEWPIK